MKAECNQKQLANFALLVCAFIWGTAFVAQSVGMEYVGPFTFQCVRSILASAFLIVVIGIRNVCRKSREAVGDKDVTGRKKLILGGICCGTALCVASSLQQIGLQYTTVGNAGFITSMYIIFVPVFSVFLGKKVPAKIWGCILVAVVGIYLLSVSETLEFAKGDAFVALCAVVFAIHIMVVDYFVKDLDSMELSCVQFLVSAIIAAVPMVFIEMPQLSVIMEAALPVLYAGILSSGVAYTLQILGQKYAEPSMATLLMSLESVFSLLGGMLILHESMSGREWVGCILVFVAVLKSQLSSPKS